MKHILVPTDFSQAAELAVPAVQEMAQRLGARVTVLYSLQFPDAPEDFAPMREHFQTLATELRGRLDDFRLKHFPGDANDAVFLTGRPATNIVNQSRILKSDLIMMPTRGWTPFRPLRIGSVASSVLQEADCPVWTSAHIENAAWTAAAHGPILCAVDLSPASLDVLRTAKSLADAFGAPLQVMHIQPSAKDPDKDYPPLAAAAGVTSPLLTVTGESVSKTLASAAENNYARLIVLSRARAHGFWGRLRSEVYTIVGQSPCPVVSV
jgi:nucleotide-binding universal stress UspA family protein